MGLFSRRKQQDTDPFGGTGYVPGADPVPVPSPAPPEATGPAAAGVPVTGSAVTIDARGIPGLRADVMKLAMSGGTPDQIMDALRQHGVNLPQGVPLAAMQADPSLVMGAPPAAPAGAPAGEDAATRLRKLQELRSGGLITEEELQAQRAKILEEL